MHHTSNKKQMHHTSNITCTIHAAASTSDILKDETDIRSAAERVLGPRARAAREVGGLFEPDQLSLLSSACGGGGGSGGNDVHPPVLVDVIPFGVVVEVVLLVDGHFRAPASGGVGDLP